jgi:hypothetical protein
MGVAVVTRGPISLSEPVEFRGRQFKVGFDVRLEGLSPVGTGVELGPLAGKLEVLPDPSSWSVRLRRSVVPLPAGDRALIERRLAKLLCPPETMTEAYLKACKVGVT